MDFDRPPKIEQIGEDRKKRSEILQRMMTMAKDVDGLDGKTAEDVFDSKDENTKREILSHLSSEQYCQLITGVNGILRGREKEDWDMDGVGVFAVGQELIGAHIFPNHNDKKEIIIKSWQGAQQMNASGRDLEEIGILLGSILVETHPFRDGNGRTSRFVYLMVKNGYSKEKISAILGDNGRDEFDMALTKIYIDDLFERKHGRLNESFNKYSLEGVIAGKDIAFGMLSFPEGTSEETKESIIQGGRNDNNIFVSGLLCFLKNHPEINAEHHVEYFGERKVFLLQSLLFSLTKELVEELEKIYWGMKKKYTEDLIDIFVNPNKPEYKIERNGSEMRMIDYFKQRIAEGQMLIP